MNDWGRRSKKSQTPNLKTQPKYHSPPSPKKRKEKQTLTKSQQTNKTPQQNTMILNMAVLISNL